MQKKKLPKELEAVKSKKATLFILVGLPGVGKTTYREKMFDPKEWKFVSSDDVIELIASGTGKTYNEVWAEKKEEAEKITLNFFQECVKNKEDIVIDRTNLTKKSRARFLKAAKGYLKIAIVFPPPSMEEWVRRLENRPGKTIPYEVLEKMNDSYEKPSTSEGFDEVDEWVG